MAKTEAEYLSSNFLSVDVDNVDVMLNDKCLVEVEVGYDDIVVGDVKLKMSRNAHGMHYDRIAHAARHGKVVRLPLAKEIIVPNEWVTDVEVEVGDDVWFEAFEGLEADKWAWKGKLYYVLPYRSLVVAKRGDDIIPLNGYVIGDLQDTQGELTVIEKAKRMVNMKILHLGTKVSYPGSRYESEHKEGDLVRLDVDYLPELEDKDHMTFGGGMHVYFHRKNIVAKKY